MKINEIRRILYTVGMILLIIIVSMNVLGYTTPKIFSYLLLLITIPYLYLTYIGRYK